MKRRRKGIGWGLIGNVAYIIFICAVLAFGIFRGLCVDKSMALRAMEKQGYNDVRVVDYHWFMVGFRGCSGHDAAKFDVVAKNPVGKKVECFVCVGWPFKGATIRTD